LTTKEATPLLRLAPFTVRAKCRAGEIVATKEGGDWDISQAAIVSYRRYRRLKGANGPMRRLMERGLAE
jgi:hypothetical protein